MKKIKIKHTLILALLCLCITGCRSTDYHTKSLHSTKERNFTLGLVQKEIYTGMSSTEVAEALGSPNMVQRDKGGSETWIYDKIASEASYSKSKGSIGGGLILGFPFVAGVGVGGAGSKSSGAAATTQRTLTVIIKFNEDNRVADCSYHSSKF